MPQYSKPLTIHKGVDNAIQFQFLNQEQRPVNVTDKYITCRILNADGTEILLSKALTIQLGATGIAALLLSAADIADIGAQKCYYSLEIPDGSFDYPVFVDQNAGARGDLYVVNSVLPSFVPSTAVSIPTNQTFPDANANINSPGRTYYSSVLSTNDPVTTVQAVFNGYTGNVTIQGSTVSDNDWYNISTYSYANLGNTTGYTVQGFHPYIRVEFVSNCGSVTNLFTR